MPDLEFVELRRPEVNYELSCQAAELILEIGNYRESRDVPRVLSDMVGRTTILALDDESVVGAAGLRILQPGQGSLEDVVSAPDLRGEGIGRGVVEAAERLAFRKAVTELTLVSSQIATGFYTKLGYQDLGDEAFRKYI